MLTETERVIVSYYEKWARKKFAGASLSHSWDHVERVYSNALKIYEAEGGDEFTIRLSVLAHDLGRIPEARGGLYRGRPVESYRGGHSTLSLFEIKDELRYLMEDEVITREQRREILYIVCQHSKLRKNPPSSRETKNLLIVKDADMLDSLGFIGVTRNLSHSRQLGLPLWANGLTIDFPDDRALVGMEAEESGLANLYGSYNFRRLLILESSRGLGELRALINGDLINLLKQEIRRGDWHNYEFWLGFVDWADNKGLTRLTSEDLEEYSK